MNTYHARELLKHLANTDTEMSVTEINKIFGVNARYKNCQDTLFSIDELLSFLSQRGKIIISQTGISVVKDKICKH